MKVQSKLPYIYIPNINLKISIDSGATNSVINRKPAFERFHNFPYRKNLTVTGIATTIKADDNFKIPILYELGILDHIHSHVADWHQNFDALLGTSELQK